MNINELIHNGEHSKVDYKREWYWNDDTPKDIKKLRYGELVKDIFSLTNGDKYSINDTAYLVIGIDDKTRQVYDFDFPKDHESNNINEEKLKQDLLQKLNTYSYPEFIALDVSYYALEGNQVIVISIPPRGELISLLKDLKYQRKGKIQIDPIGTIYYRRGESNHSATENIIEDFKRAYQKEYRQEILRLVELFGVKGEEFLRSLFGDDYEKVLENPKTYKNLKLKLEQKNQTLESLLKEKVELEKKIKSQNLDSDIEQKVEQAIQELRFDDVIDILNKYLTNTAVTHDYIYKAHYLKAIIYVEMFRYSDAKEEIEYIPYKKLKDFGRLNDYAQIYRLNKQYNDAIEIYHFISLILEEYLKLHPFEFAMLFTNIAEVSESVGQFENTERYYRKALEILKNYSGSNHNESIVINKSLAIVYSNLGSLLGSFTKYDEAEEYLEKSLSIRHALYGDNHIDTIDSYNNIAALYTNKGDYSKAEILFLKSLNLSLKVLGEKHPQTAIAYNNLAEIYRKKGDYTFEKIDELYNKSLEIRKDFYREDNDSIASIYNNKGELYRENEESKEAIKYYKKALTIYKKVFVSKIHPDIATVYNNMGLAYGSLKQYIPSIDYLEKALEIRIKVSIDKEKDFNIGASHLNLSTTYLELKNKKDAYSHIKKVIDIWEKNLLNNDSRLIKAKNMLFQIDRE